MNKYNKKIICMFVFAMIVFPSVIKAESFQYNLKAVVDGANSKIKDTAKYCYTYGCRSGNMGVKISIYNGNTLKTIESSEEVGKDASSNIRIAGVVSNIEDGFNDLATKINKQPTNTDTIEFNDFCNFLNQNDPVLGYGLIHTYQYRVLSSYWSKFRIEQNAINNCDLNSGKFDIKKDNFSRGVGEPPTHDNYIKYFERRNPYIVMEPMISITVSDKENQKASKAFSTFGIDALPDKIMERIKSVSNGKANANTDNISNFMAKTFCNFGGAEQTSCQAITDLYESATPQDLDKLASAWNTVVENFHTEGTKQTKTVKEWAEWIMTGTNYKYVGANSDGTLSSEASKLGGSVTSWIKDISWYFHLGENIGPFTKVSSKATSWKSIVGMTNGYGIIVLKVSINSYDDSKYKCRYLDGKIKPPEGKEKKDCCEETNIWSDYDVKTGKSGYWKEFYDQTDSNKDRYIDICPVEIEDNYCKWNGNKTERYQIVNGKELDCCIYSNYGENAKTVTGFKTEDDFKEYGWYKNNCGTDIDIEPPQYCTIQKLQNGDTSCCHQEGLNKWSPSFRQDMRSDGYADTPAGLEEYLKYKIGVNKYNRLCGKECTYEIESLCPSCDNEDTSYGLVMDTVGGSDSTALKLSNETEKCILNNNDYLYQNNSYCKIYCTEKVEYSLPKRSTLSVTAGTRLVVGGNLSPVESKTTITCRRTEIDTAKFESDLKGKIDALKAAYDAYTEASVPLNENKIITHYDDGTHVSRSEWDCDCKNNVGSGIVSNNICCESVSYEDSGLSHGRLVVAATYTSFDATPIYNDCYGGEWKILSHTTWSEDNCGEDGASDPKGKGIHKNECKLTKPDPNPSCVGGHRERTGFESCGSGYSLVGEQCVPDSIPGCSKSGGTVTCKTVSCDSSYGNGLTERKLVSTHSGYTTSLSNSMCSYAYCSKRNYDRYDFQTVDAYRYGYNKLLPKGAQGQICENESGYYQPKYESLKETRKKALLAAWNDYNSVINNLNMCYNFTDRVKSNYKININLSYQNGSYSIDTLLDSSVSQSSDKNFTQTVSTRGYRNCGTMTGVDFLNCEQETKYYTENINGTYAAGTSTNTYTYTLPNNSSMYRYVNKSSLSEKDSNINSIYIGPHLPVAYNEKDNKIEVELTPSVVRTNTTGTIYITKTRNDFESEICTDSYKCDSVTPGKTKIVPVYRVIALDSPFPDEDGNGRLTGRNWCSGSDCSNTNAVVQKVITNNRGVNENEVYRLTPLYTLVLTPSTVKKIREYNSQTSYGDYNLICEKDTGKYCKSLYLRGEPDKEGNIINNNLEQMGVLKRDKSCALNENLSGCMPGDYYERGA